MKRCNKIICLVLIFVSLFLLTSCVCASDNSTDSIDTAKNNEFNVSSKSGVDLNNLINGNESGDEIVLDDDFVFNMSKDGFDFTGIKINRSVSIDGHGHSIDGINYYRVFAISADNVVLKNINVGDLRKFLIKQIESCHFIMINSRYILINSIRPF